jgi:hypothetical protein
VDRSDDDRDHPEPDEAGLRAQASAELPTGARLTETAFTDGISDAAPMRRELV